MPFTAPKAASVHLGLHFGGELIVVTRFAAPLIERQSPGCF